MRMTMYFVVENGEVRNFQTDDEILFTRETRKPNVFTNRLVAKDYADSQLTEIKGNANKVNRFQNPTLEEIREIEKAEYEFALSQLTETDKLIVAENKANEVDINEEQRKFAFEHMTEDDFRIIREMKRERYKKKNKLRFNEKEQKSFHEFMERQAKRVVER